MGPPGRLYGLCVSRQQCVYVCESVSLRPSLVVLISLLAAIVSNIRSLRKVTCSTSFVLFYREWLKGILRSKKCTMCSELQPALKPSAFLTMPLMSATYCKC